MRRHELSDEEWAVIQPLLPNKPRGVPRVDDRRVLNGILWRFRTGAPWRDVPERYGPRTTLYNRFVRWRAAGVWDRVPGGGEVVRTFRRGEGIDDRADGAPEAGDGAPSAPSSIPSAPMSAPTTSFRPATMQTDRIPL